MPKVRMYCWCSQSVCYVTQSYLPTHFWGGRWQLSVCKCTKLPFVLLLCSFCSVLTQTGAPAVFSPVTFPLGDGRHGRQHQHPQLNVLQQTGASSRPCHSWQQKRMDGQGEGEGEGGGNLGKWKCQLHSFHLDYSCCWRLSWCMLLLIYTTTQSFLLLSLISSDLSLSQLSIRTSCFWLGPNHIAQLRFQKTQVNAVRLHHNQLY